MVKKQLLAALALTFSFSAYGTDFSEAEAKFALRDSTADHSATLEARAAYKAIIDSGVKDADLVRAVEGYLRTYIFEGTHYTTTNAEGTEATPAGTGKETRKKIFNDAWKTAVELIPAAARETSPVYYYFKASAIAYEAEVSNVLQRLVLLPQLNDALAKGLAVEGGATYEGGGLLRVKAAVKGNPEAKGLPGGLYNPEEALKLVDQAIASEAYPDNAEGIYFCENFRRKVITQNELKDVAGALATADQALLDFPAYLADSLIPEFIRAETVDCIKTITELKTSISPK